MPMTTNTPAIADIRAIAGLIYLSNRHCVAPSAGLGQHVLPSGCTTPVPPVGKSQLTVDPELGGGPTARAAAWPGNSKPACPPGNTNKLIVDTIRQASRVATGKLTHRT